MPFLTRSPLNTNLHLPSGLPATSALARRQILPEEGMVDMAASVEVDQGLQRNLGLDVLLLLCCCELFGRRIETVNIGLVMVLVVELHDFTGDGGFERAIVICKELMSLCSLDHTKLNSHGRSGRVALPRMKLILAIAAARLEAPARRAERAAVEVRRRVADMATFEGVQLRFCGYRIRDGMDRGMIERSGRFCPVINPYGQSSGVHVTGRRIGKDQRFALARPSTASISFVNKDTTKCLVQDINLQKRYVLTTWLRATVAMASSYYDIDAILTDAQVRLQSPPIPPRTKQALLTNPPRKSPRPSNSIFPL
jgi:hypothetical protein